ncbi:ABC transporter permease [Actinomyces sp. 594]|nr:ABC transporter permease [Actinomyces sp. 594]
MVARVTVHELSRRRGALALALLLPLTFYLARIDTHWTALRLLSIGLGWATATLALFTSVSSRSIDLRLAASGASPTALVLGRHAAVLGLGWLIAALYSGLVLLTIGNKLAHPTSVPLMLLLTVTVAAPLGSVAAALIPRDLEGALLLLAVMALQLLVDPTAAWTRVLPLWSTRELSSYIVEALGTQADDYLQRGLLHGVGFAVGLVVLTWLLGIWRLRVIRLPEPQ